MNKKRVMLLTGSPGRLGSAFCEKYYEDYFVVGVARHKRSNFAHEFIEADITKNAEDLVHKILVKHKRIDVLVNNAADYAIKPLRELDETEMLALYETNVIAPHNLAKLIFNKFWRTRYERNKALNRNIINVSSISATNVFNNQGAYASSKAALNMLSMHMAVEYNPFGLRVNVLAPTAFPAQVSCEMVADAVVELDQSDMNGMIKEVVKHQSRTYTLVQEDQ